MRESKINYNPSVTVKENAKRNGVTEAANSQEELFGEGRLVETLGASPSAAPGTLLPFVREKVGEFVQDAPQFDDITMLGLLYKG